MFRLIRPQTLIFLPVSVIFAAAVYGFAASNVVPESGAGDGTGTISGYTITNIDYNLNATTPTNIDSVDFDINPTAGASAPGLVKIKLVSAGGNWYTCSVTVSPNWSCTTTSPQATVATANQLQVVATE